MPTTEQFIAGAERNVRVIKAITQAMEALQRMELAAVEVDGECLKLEFSREIAGLREALYLMGQDVIQ